MCDTCGGNCPEKERTQYRQGETAGIRRGSGSAKPRPRRGFDANLAEATLRRKPTAKTPVADEKTPRVSETILLVEDEAAVRALAKRILIMKGYRVLEASDGAIALRVAAAHVGEIDLVLTDVAMPNLGGRGMVEELKELSPGMRSRGTQSPRSRPARPTTDWCNADTALRGRPSASCRRGSLSWVPAA